MKNTAIVLISVVLAISGVFFLQNSGVSVGAITTILGTDKLSDSRTTINDNFTDLDTTKMEMSTTSLPVVTTMAGLTSAATLATIGTITTGVWTGTDVTVANGGTGLSTLTANAVMLGAGTSNVNFVSGLGSSGQLLTSNGAAADPTWQTSTVSLSDSYVWTGVHNFTNSITYIKGLNASSTAANPLILNGISFSFPATQGAASTTLTNSGAGVLTWVRPEFTLIASTTVSSAVATTTASWTTISGGNDLKVVVFIPSFGANINRVLINFNADVGANYSWHLSRSGTGENDDADSAINLSGGLSSQTIGTIYHINIVNTAQYEKFVSWTGGKLTGANVVVGAGSWTDATAQITSITLGSGDASTMAVGTRISVYASTE